MLFNLQWESNKKKIAIIITDEEQNNDYVFIKPDLSNAFNKKIVKKIFKKITLHFNMNLKYEVIVDDESFVQANIDYKVINNVKTLELMLKELLHDIFEELKSKAQIVYV